MKFYINMIIDSLTIGLIKIGVVCIF